MTWKITENWQIETNFNIKDTYEFHYFNSNWEYIENIFNTSARYYQDKWYGFYRLFIL
jgi:hypothetical protein